MFPHLPLYLTYVLFVFVFFLSPKLNGLRSAHLPVWCATQGPGRLICCGDGRICTSWHERVKGTICAPPYWLSSRHERLPHAPLETCRTRRQEFKPLLMVHSSPRSWLTRRTKFTSPCQLVYGPCLSSSRAAVFSPRLGWYRQTSRRPVHCVFSPVPRLSSHPYVPCLRRTPQLERFISL